MSKRVAYLLFYKNPEGVAVLDSYHTSEDSQWKRGSELKKDGNQVAFIRLKNGEPETVVVDRLRWYS